jgi:hypothetical protein
VKSIAPTRRNSNSDFTTADIKRALRRAHRVAVKTAQMHNLPLVYFRNGKIVREKP